jgi:hypothetical protein
MIKSEIRSRFYNALPKYDTDNKFHPLVIDNAIEKALLALYNVEFKLDPIRLARYTKRYGGTTAVTVALDAIAGVYYSNYPEKVVNFPDKSSGVRRVTTRVQGGFVFFPLDERELEFIGSGSNVATVNSKIGYIPTRERIEYYNISAAIVAAGVRMDLVIPFSKYAETDDVYIPEVKDDDGKTFDNLVLEFLGVIQPPDVIDDNKTEVKETK